MPLDTVEERLRAVGRRLAFGLGWTASFAVGSLGAFLLFDWPPLLHALIARVLLRRGRGVAHHDPAAVHPGAGRRAVSHPAGEHGIGRGIGTCWLTLAVGWYARRPCPALVSDRSWPVRAVADTCSPTSFRWSGWPSCCWRSGDGPRAVRTTEPSSRAARDSEDAQRADLLRPGAGLAARADRRPQSFLHAWSILATLAGLLRITNLSAVATSCAHRARSTRRSGAAARRPSCSSAGLRALWIIGAALAARLDLGDRCQTRCPATRRCRGCCAARCTRS